jgi:hypothetical protein
MRTQLEWPPSLLKGLESDRFSLQGKRGRGAACNGNEKCNDDAQDRLRRSAIYGLQGS